jgi:hypothetical protein
VEWSGAAGTKRHNPWSLALPALFHTDTEFQDPKRFLTRGLIPSLVDQDRYAQSRDPIEMIVQG